MPRLLPLTVSDVLDPTLVRLTDEFNAARARTGDPALTPEQYAQHRHDEWLDREAREYADREAARTSTLYQRASLEDRAAVDLVLAKYRT